MPLSARGAFEGVWLPQLAACPVDMYQLRQVCALVRWECWDRDAGKTTEERETLHAPPPRTC
jgi:hypothetical protein